MMKYNIGLDLGSRNTKIIVISIEDKQIAYRDCLSSGVNPRLTAQALIEKAKDALSIHSDEIQSICSTGYGRNLTDSHNRLSEITCHTKGVLFFYPAAATIIDIGGQDFKLITVNEKGFIRDFLMNDKCAAGTGRFLEMVAQKLNLSCDELSRIHLSSKLPEILSSVCVVFAESEIIGLISKGKPVPDIILAVYHSIASRIVANLSHLSWQPPVVFTGGVALHKNLGIVFNQILETEVIIPAFPEFTGALGAALLA